MSDIVKVPAMQGIGDVGPRWSGDPITHSPQGSSGDVSPKMGGVPFIGDVMGGPCLGTRKDGAPCGGNSTANGYCAGHNKQRDALAKHQG